MKDLDLHRKNIKEGLTFLVGFLGMIGMLGGVSLFLYQLGRWLKDGIWKSYSLFDGLLMCCKKDLATTFLLWMLQPSDWIGLHKLFVGFLELIPLSLFLFIVGLTVVLFTGHDEHYG